MESAIYSIPWILTPLNNRGKEKKKCIMFIFFKWDNWRVIKVYFENDEIYKAYPFFTYEVEDLGLFSISNLCESNWNVLKLVSEF